MSTGPGKFETYQHSRLSAAEATRLRLIERATALLEASMMPSTPTHKHKWATGGEKRESQQDWGRRAATGRGRGRPRKEVDWSDKLTSFMDELRGFQLASLNPDPEGLPLELLQIRLREQLANLEINGVITGEVAMATRLLIG